MRFYLNSLLTFINLKLTDEIVLNFFSSKDDIYKLLDVVYKLVPRSITPLSMLFEFGYSPVQESKKDNIYVFNCH